ncbi:MAG: hypothetical protein FJ147_13080 [Deltaproteobacteria bacterium]|nr:hypothetical protein [Deltaproteobacteria bacterium]
MLISDPYDDCVFINCPFDEEYKPLFEATIFCVQDAGFVSHCALEFSDSSQNRLSKILDLIAACKYGIHDISRVSLDIGTSLPRFNMPLELGVFLGCKAFGNRLQRTKCCLVLDSEPYRYRGSISDIAGQDIEVHRNEVNELIRRIRGWLTTASKRTTIPGGETIAKRFDQFCSELPAICNALHKRVEELTFLEYKDLVAAWLRQNSLQRLPSATRRR